MNSPCALFTRSGCLKNFQAERHFLFFSMKENFPEFNGIWFSRKTRRLTNKWIWPYETEYMSNWQKTKLNFSYLPIDSCLVVNQTNSCLPRGTFPEMCVNCSWWIFVWLMYYWNISPRPNKLRKLLKKNTRFPSLTNNTKKLYFVLTHLFPMHPFTTPWKHQKTVKFSDVFMGRERMHLEQMG